MNNKKLLVICFSFPPSVGIGGRRWAKFANYIAKSGIDIQVLAARNKGLQISDWHKDTIGLQKENISFSHPEFHRKEATLMSSRNATREDFEQVIKCIKQKDIRPETYITHRVIFDEVATKFESWLDPANGVIKAMVEMK